MVPGVAMWEVVSQWEPAQVLGSVPEKGLTLVSWSGLMQKSAAEATPWDRAPSAVGWGRELSFLPCVLWCHNRVLEARVLEYCLGPPELGTEWILLFFVKHLGPGVFLRQWWLFVEKLLESQGSWSLYRKVEIVDDFSVCVLGLGHVNPVVNLPWFIKSAKLLMQSVCSSTRVRLSTDLLGGDNSISRLH